MSCRHKPGRKVGLHSVIMLCSRPVTSGCTTSRLRTSYIRLEHTLSHKVPGQCVALIRIFLGHHVAIAKWETGKQSKLKWHRTDTKFHQSHGLGEKLLGRINIWTWWQYNVIIFFLIQCVFIIAIPSTQFYRIETSILRNTRYLGQR
jgi:hypothetical protein